MGAQQERIALVTIRYNQKVISYKGQLYNAVTEAVKTKPTVVFDVVSYAPVGRDAKSNMKLSERAYSYGAQVAEDIKRMGVNPQQVTFSSQQDPRISFEEVRVFVR
ncbi:MAG: hypothetical protein COV36_02235 [Alphaproteobacteria bacterium CG11_big_fil_rev_8_21_14_0_20_44_7]|nr:MAG: hypothetical protein COV36_02235 [Alphaproteobacteria bacterium CG11_big_fil_rev_8_21_14_0_20_44_7]